MKRFVFLLVALAGCGTATTIPPEERAASGSIFGLTFDRWAADGDVERTYQLPRGAPADVADTLRTLHGGTVTLEGDRLRVVNAAPIHSLVPTLLRAVGAAPRVRSGVVAYDIPKDTASTLGEIELARGARTSSPFFLVPLTAAELEHLDRLAREGRAEESWSSTAEGVAGEWLTCRSETQSLHLAGARLRDEAGIGHRFVRNGLSVRAACFPVADGSRIVVFRVFESLELMEETIATTAFEGRTRVPVELPGTLERRAEDAVLLAPDEAIGLLARSNRPGFVRLVVLSVTAGT